MGEFEDKLNSILSSPEEMGKIMDLARSLSSSVGGGSQGGGAPQPGNASASDLPASVSALGDIDPRLMQIMSRIIGEYSSEKDDQKAVLLSSIKPYLKEDRREMIDRALEILKLSKIAKIAMKEFGGDFHL